MIKLKPGREVPLLAGHPWVFSMGIEGVPEVTAGGLVEVVSSSGEFVGIGTYHPANTIRVRMVSRKREKVDAHFFRKRFTYLLEAKKRILPPDTDGFRLAHADADGMPGLVVDLYADVAVFQVHTAGMEPFRELIVEALSNLPGIRSVVERSDVEARRMERLPLREPAVLAGRVEGPVTFKEGGMVMRADPLKGQKTGFFLDQREARQWVRETTQGRRVVNLFSYSCAFGVAAKLGGAEEVLNVDVSERALTVGAEMFRENGIAPETRGVGFLRMDVFEYLERETGSFPVPSVTTTDPRPLPVVGKPAEHDMRGKTDLLADVRATSPRTSGPLYLICDPPAFAKSRKDLESAVKAYERLNTLCFSLLRTGDLFLTSSCSGMVSLEQFLEILRLSVGRAGKEARILRILGQAADHTRTLAFPEGAYLKTVCLEVL